MSQRVLNNALCRRYLTEEFGYDLRLKQMANICIIRNVITLQIILKKQNSEK